MVDLKTIEWVDVNDKLPENEKYVLVCCKSRFSRPYICIGYHINRHSVEGNIYWNEDLEWDYDEDEDKNYVPEGWYEAVRNWDEYSSVVISDDVTHWAELPELPTIWRNARDCY